MRSVHSKADKYNFDKKLLVFGRHGTGSLHYFYGFYTKLFRQPHRAEIQGPKM